MSERQIFERSVRIEASAEEVFAWHESEGAFERLAPPWERIEIVSRRGGIRDGGRIEIAMPTGPIRRRWVAVHSGYVKGEQFVDEQIEGPFKYWKHTHRMEAEGPDACVLHDRIEYELPGGAAGNFVAGAWVQKKLAATFEYRHKVTKRDVEDRATRWGEPNMKIAVTGASGLVGRTLIPMLQTQGVDVVRLVRSMPGGDKDAIYWQPNRGEIDAEKLDGVDAVVHLAGEGIAEGRWTQAKMARIRGSRVQGTKLIAETIANLKSPPSVLVCASAIGYYGERGNEAVTEDSDPGTGFLPEVCKEWEASADPAREKGIRVVHLRLGVVLSPAGGALAKMLLPFRMGLGGVIGSGDQYMSWISLDDVIGAIRFAIEHEELAGPVNAVAPAAVTNREFTKILGKVLRRPTVFPVPAFVARLAFGQMGEDLLLASTRVEPRRLVEAGYEFRHRDLESALRELLGKHN